MIFACVIASASAAVWLNNHVIVNGQVISGSMEGTIMADDRVFGLRIFAQINRGDIIVFTSPIPGETSEIFIKRVIATAGEVVEIRNGATFINGTHLAEDYLNEPMIRDFLPMTVGEGQLFVMGDNRNNSRDSRDFGTICAGSILGRIYIY